MKFTIETLNDNGSGMLYKTKEDFLKEVGLMIDDCIANGGTFFDIQVEPLTDDDLKEFYEACVAFEQEYEAAEASIKYPTLEEIKDKAMRVTAKRLFELETVEQWFKTRALEAAAKLSAYEWKQVQEYTKNLMADVKRFDPETYPQTIVGTSRSFDFVKPEYEMKDSYWFKYLHELFENRCTN